MLSADWITPDWSAPANVAAGTSTRSASIDELPGEPARVKQVHGTTVINSKDPVFGDGPPEADGVISRSPNDIIAVRTADCLPVLLCSTAGDEIAAVHCGWRGLAADILAQTLGQMQTSPEQLMAWLGPAISQSAFEVQDEVREAFVDTDEHAARCFAPNERGRWQADLYGLARLKLAASGVSDVHGGGFCTHSDPARFFSYRRDGDTGRMVSFIVMR